MRNQQTIKNKKDEDAVSPVIGVILMVAITVVLAAVVGLFVFGLTDSFDSTVTMGVDFTENNGTVLTVVDSGNADSFVVECAGSSNTVESDFNETRLVGTYDLDQEVDGGGATECDESGATITVFGKTNEGAESVIQSYEVQG